MRCRAGRARGGGTITLWILASRMAPPIAFTIPYFLVYRHLELLDTLTGLIIIYLTFNLSLVIWMMRPFYDQLPRSLEEAAWIDGATMWQGFYRIILPLSGPGLAATAILCFLFAWNDFFFALILTRTEAMTAPVAVVNFMNYEGWEWGRIAAGGTMIMLPVLVFSFVVRRYLVHGLTGGAIERMTLLITGGASGIGAETARRAAKRGYKVAINYRSRDAQAKKVVADIAAKGGQGDRPAGRHGAAKPTSCGCSTRPSGRSGRSPIWSTAPASAGARGSTNSTRRCWPNLFAINVDRPDAVLPRGRAAHVDQARRQGRRDRQRLVDGRAPSAAGRARRPMPRARPRSIPSPRASPGRSPPRASGSIRCGPAWC